MITFTATIKKFEAKGEKSGWTYIIIPEKEAAALQPKSKKSFRVKGSLDELPIKQASVLPMGDGTFLLALNASMRRALKKKAGNTLNVQIQKDNEVPSLPAELEEALAQCPTAATFFDSLPLSHRNYYINWIKTVKTEPARIAKTIQVIQALESNLNFAGFMAFLKEQKQKFSS